MSVELESFEDLVHAAHAQPVWQRFLLVFVKTVLPGDAGPAQIARFEARQGGALEPVMYADKSERELTDFAALVAEARHTGDTLGGGVESAWDLVIVGCLDGREDGEPSPQEVDAALNDLLRAIRTGQSLGHLVAFDRSGNSVRFQ